MRGSNGRPPDPQVGALTAAPRFILEVGRFISALMKLDDEVKDI